MARQVGWAGCAVMTVHRMETLEEAFASGTLVRKSGSVVCACAPFKRFTAGWGPKACEWKAHRQREPHRAWARAQPGRRKLRRLEGQRADLDGGRHVRRRRKTLPIPRKSKVRV